MWPVNSLGPAGMPGLPHHYGLDLLSQAKWLILELLLIMIFYHSNKNVINVVSWAEMEIEILVEYHTTLLEHDGKEAKSCSEAESQSPYPHSVYT